MLRSLPPGLDGKIKIDSHLSKPGQRMVYIIGEMFDIDHNLGAEILGISTGNFRIRLIFLKFLI